MYVGGGGGRLPRTWINIAYISVKVVCRSSCIQAHIHVLDTAREIGWIIRDGRTEELVVSSCIQAHIHVLDTAREIGWIIRDGRTEELVVSDQGKCLIIGRMVASENPEA